MTIYDQIGSLFKTGRFQGYNPWFLGFLGQNEKTRYNDVWGSRIETGFGGIQLSPLVREKNRFYVLGQNLGKK